MRPFLGVTSAVRAIAVIVALSASAIPAFPNGFTIVPTFDGSITSDANATKIEASINAAISQIESYFTDNITVPIQFIKETTGLGNSSTAAEEVTYTAYRNALIADASDSDDAGALFFDLPDQANSPVDGQADMLLTVANGQALGLNGPATFDGTIYLNTSIMNFDRSNINLSFYDAQSVVMHEMDEVLGLGSGLNIPLGQRESRAQDLFRYSAPGVRSYSSAAPSSYFSIDGGATNLVNFYQGAGGDYGDWKSVNGSPKVQDAIGTPGSVPAYGVEVRDLDVIGYNLVTPEPGTWLLLAAGIGLITLRSRRAATRTE
ncbi:MAG TPA: NF038122 family metalloprotease [Bryobacteraceae bacterium]|jgi:hypothetical protein|nr:NF038122 family metalloprotease [Bryobacteraceae bacterium]